MVRNKLIVPSRDPPTANGTTNTAEDIQVISQSSKFRTSCRTAMVLENMAFVSDTAQNAAGSATRQPQASQRSKLSFGLAGRNAPDRGRASAGYG